MSRLIYDCIVVGAGPGGSSAAYHLARRGFSVLLVEKEKLPRYKPCGGVVIDRVAEWFDFDFSPAIAVKVSQLKMWSDRPGGYNGDLHLPRPVWMVHREVFDYFIVQQAQRLGAVLRDQFRVTGLTKRTDGWRVTSGDCYEDCRYLIAADGARGTLASLLGFSNRQRLPAVAVEAEIPAAERPSPTMHLSFFGHLTGYAWNFPKEQSHSVGVGMWQSNRLSLRKELDEYCRTFGLSPADGRVFGHPLLLWDGDQPLHAEHALLAGESACTVDPWSAEGIRPAMMSGVAAAESISDALGGLPDALENYSRKLREGHGREMALARMMTRSFYSGERKPGPDKSHSRLALELSARLICGEITYQKYLMGHGLLSALHCA